MIIPILRFVRKSAAQTVIPIIIIKIKNIENVEGKEWPLKLSKSNKTSHAQVPKYYTTLPYSSNLPLILHALRSYHTAHIKHGLYSCSNVKHGNIM